MLDLIRLSRPYYAAPMSLAYLLTLCYALGGRGAGQRAGAIASTAAVALVVASAYVINDVWDAAADRVNQPARPVAAGRVSRRAGAVWGLALLAGGLAAGAACRWQFLAVLAAVAAGLMLYDAFSKRLGPAKQLVVAGLMTSLYPLALAQAGGAPGQRAPTLPAFALWMFLTAFAYECLKDIRDIPGDRAVSPRPAPVHRRPRLWRRLAGAATLAGAAALFAPPFLGCGWVYVTVIPTAIAAAVASLFLPVRRAIAAVYAECCLVGLAAAADIMIG